MIQDPCSCFSWVTGMQVMPAHKARKTAKARRHTTASRISNSGMPFDVPIVDAGRPSPI